MTPGAPEQLLRRLEWTVVRRLAGRELGEHRTTHRGTGVDVADMRSYEPYDDVRHIDWNVTARLDEPHVREYHEDRDIVVWLLIDRTRSMTFGPIDRGKEAVAVDISVALARLLTRGGNRVGALLFDGLRVEVVRPGCSRAHILRLAHELLRTVPGGGSATDLAALLGPAVSTLRRRSLIFVISDFISAPGWERPLAALARRHEVVAVRLADRREWELPSIGSIVVEDAETGEQLLVDTSDPAFRAQYRANAEQRDTELHEATAGVGIRLHTVLTDDDLITALIRMTRDQRRRR